MRVVLAAAANGECELPVSAIAIKLFTIFSALLLFLHTCQDRVSGLLELGASESVPFVAGRSLSRQPSMHFGQIAVSRTVRKRFCHI